MALFLPRRVRAPVFGWLVGRVVAPIAGFNHRIRANLDFIELGLSESEVRRLCRAVNDNFARTLIENYATDDLLETGRQTELTGPGIAAMEEARASGQAIILVTGHFGNYEVPRAALISRGWTVGGLYRPMNNPFFNAHYAQTMHRLGGPVFPRGRRGTAGFVKHLRSGGAGVLLIDQYFRRGAVLEFFGKPAPTALSAAELALKYDALMVPFYGIRQPDGRSFEAVFEAPIRHSDPATMTQAFNDSLEARVREHMGQWFWVHRRWKPERSRRPSRSKKGAAAQRE
jgi:KDO2-lipid IV(A) lauroyltransferase